ncbi:MAG: hypothetical protein ACXVBE_18155, partial [Bdellovibrionota bacterium]
MDTFSKPNICLRLLSASAALAFCFLTIPALGAGTEINQTNAQAVAEELNRKGSDQSMQSSTTSA